MKAGEGIGKSRGTILVVDDESDVVFFVTKVCQPQGYHTLTASSGEDAVKLVEDLDGRIDLVLLDLKMPGMSGIEVLKWMRSRYGHLPVIVLTALGAKKEECEAIGVEAFVAKPYSLEDLYHKITHVIARKELDEKCRELEGKKRGATEGFLPCAKILIVDDEIEVCDILAECLTSEIIGASYQVRTAANGHEALKIANEFEPDIAIVDIRMQHMWGDELIERFKAGEAYCPKDFIICTGADVPEQREKAKRAGYGYLTKPHQVEDLLNVLSQICLRHGLVKTIKN